jgi:hypothetical protein
MKTLIANSSGMANVVPARGGGVRDWQRWAPYAAVTWSLLYAALGVYWAVGGSGFPYSPENTSDMMEPLLGRFGPEAAWVVVMLAGFPAAALGAAMLRGVQGKVLRPLLITAGALLAGVLLLLMTSLDLLVKFGYTPLAVINIVQGTEFGQTFLEGLTQWKTVHQFLCLAGGFIWLAATLSYARRSVNACLYCGSRDDQQGWSSPSQAARWGRIAVYIAIVAPVFYAFTRYAWALGFPLGMNEARFLSGQEMRLWIVGALSHGNFMLLGAVLMLGLVQRWGEVFPPWMVGLAGRRVPIALAVIPASLVSVLLVVGGIAIWSGLPVMLANFTAAGADGSEIIGAIVFELGPTLLFPLWGLALVVATLGYYYRRRGPCSICGRGTYGEVRKPSSN